MLVRGFHLKLEMVSCMLLELWRWKDRGGGGNGNTPSTVNIKQDGRVPVGLHHEWSNVLI